MRSRCARPGRSGWRRTTGAETCPRQARLLPSARSRPVSEFARTPVPWRDDPAARAAYATYRRPAALSVASLGSSTEPARASSRNANPCERCVAGLERPDTGRQLPAPGRAARRARLGLSRPPASGRAARHVDEAGDRVGGFVKEVGNRGRLHASRIPLQTRRSVKSGSRNSDREETAGTVRSRWLLPQFASPGPDRARYEFGAPARAARRNGDNEHLRDEGGTR